MQAIITSLTLAAVSGLAFVAVKHPAVYEKLFGKLYFLSGVAFTCAVVWSSAVSVSYSAVLPFFAPEKAAAAKEAIEQLSVPLLWPLMAQLAAMAYLFFLSWLGQQVKEDKDSNKADA